MDDIIGRTFAAILIVATILVGVALFLNTADSNIQTKIKDDSVSFVDSCRGLGKITPDLIYSYLQKVGACGEFEATVTVERQNAYYDDVNDKVSHTTSFVLMPELLDRIFATGGNQDYVLRTGDRISVKVTRTGAGFTAMLGFIGRGGQNGDLITEYGGLVLHDGR